MTSQQYHLCFDFDSTIITKESLDEVIAFALEGDPKQSERVKAIEAITKEGMEGTLPFTTSVDRRLAAVPLTREDFLVVGEQLTHHITPGMEELFAELHTHPHITTYILSGGFFDSIRPTAEKLGVPPERVLTNDCRYDSTGHVLGVDTDSVCYTNAGKAPVIEALRRAVLPGRFVMIGDGANDLAAYTSKAADTFCAFAGNQERAAVCTQAPYVAHTTVHLHDFIFAQVTV